MNTVEMLLKLDAKKIELPKKEVEVKRLSDLVGSPFILKLQGLDSKTQDEVREMGIKENDIDYKEVKLGTILAGVKEPSLRDESLRKHFGAVTPYDLIQKLFTPGESDALYEEISKLSGYGDNAVEEIKN